LHLQQEDKTTYVLINSYFEGNAMARFSRLRVIFSCRFIPSAHIIFVILCFYFRPFILLPFTTSIAFLTSKLSSP